VTTIGFGMAILRQQRERVVIRSATAISIRNCVTRCKRCCLWTTHDCCSSLVREKTFISLVRELVLDPVDIPTERLVVACVSDDAIRKIPFHHVVTCPYCSARFFWFPCLEEGLVARPDCPKCKHMILIIDSVAHFDPNARKPPQTAR
jgi:hypothetical protein